jgi:uroporphyrinogen-III synthase
MMLTCYAFIIRNPILFKYPENYDVLFISSPKSLQFIDLTLIPEHIRYACVGSGSKEALEKHNKKVSFFHKTPGDPFEVSKAFLKFLKTKTVFFPVSNKSLGSISETIPENQKIIIPIYRTKPREKYLGEQDVYIFTSPSNVEGFLKTNIFPNSCKIIAWGKSTQKSLLNLGYKADYTLKRSSEEELVALFKAEIIV